MDNNKNPKNVIYRAYFKHYINGKIYYAKDYGHKAWPIGKNKKS